MNNGGAEKLSAAAPGATITFNPIMTAVAPAPLVLPDTSKTSEALKQMILERSGRKASAE